MELFKHHTLLVPIISYFIIKSAKNYIDKMFSPRNEKKLNEMVSCSVCNTFVHESIVVKKSGKEYCSTECSNL